MTDSKEGMSFTEGKQEFTKGQQGLKVTGRNLLKRKQIIMNVSHSQRSIILKSTEEKGRKSHCPCHLQTKQSSQKRHCRQHFHTGTEEWVLPNRAMPSLESR